VVPLALPSMVPATVALPNAAKITGRVPVSRNVAPAAIVKFTSGRTTTSAPPGCVCTTGTGVGCEHQLPKVSVFESNVEIPQLSVVVPFVAAGLMPGPVGLKFFGV
jgi:hypothetical protein